MELSKTNLPVSFSTTILFGFLWVGIDEARLGKVFGSQMLIFLLLTLDDGVVTVAELVGASHCEAERQQRWPDIYIDGNSDNKEDEDGFN